MFPITLFGRCADLPIRERIGLPIVFLCLVGAVALGLDMVIRPRQHLRGYGGGEMLRDLKETEIQMLGALVIGGACWAIYRFVIDVCASCFA